MPANAPAPRSNEPSEAGQATSVLVVDDTAEIRFVLRALLARHGITPLEAADGASAVAMAREHRPDCVLLDVNLPDLDGFEVCARLKDAPETHDIPIIFLTAADEPDLVVKGLSSGANDYVGKPINPQVLMARVHVALRLHRAEAEERRAREATEEAYRQLQSARADLQVAHKMTGLTVLAAGLAHEMNSPLGAVSTNLEFIAEEIADVMAELDAPARERLRECAEAASEAVGCCKRISRIVQRMRTLGEKARSRTLSSVDVAAMVRRLAKAHGECHGCRIDVGGAHEASIHGVEIEIQEALSAVLDNAVVASTAARGEDAHVRVLVEPGDLVRVCIDDNGDGIDPDDLPFIFDPFFTRKQQWRSVGLGLGVALSIITRHGGHIDVKPRGELGGAHVELGLPLGAVPVVEPGPAFAPRRLPTQG